MRPTLLIALLSACDPSPEAAPAVCALEVSPELEFAPSDGAICDSDALVIRNTANLNVQCQVEGLRSDCAATDFDLPVGAVSLEAGAEVRLEVSFCPTENLSCQGSIVLRCDTVEAGPVCDLGGGQTGQAIVDVVGYAFSPDHDSDGYTDADEDCDDGDPAIHPNATEQENHRDDDCDGETDEGTALADDDGDGFSEWIGDCDDSNPFVHPGREEVADGADQDCNGRIDDYCDLDNDGVLAESGDCDNNNPTIYPGAPEGQLAERDGVAGDGADNDCDGLVDEGTTWFDDDGDGWSERAGDCDDYHASSSPAAGEINCDAIDNDCDGRVDNGSDCFDDDGDGFSEQQGDCDDGNPGRSPANAEIRNNGVDDDCNEITTD